MSLPGPRFRFTTSTEDPVARVTCVECGWQAAGPDTRVVFPLADVHICRTAVARNDEELVGALAGASTLPLGVIDDVVNEVAE